MGMSDHFSKGFHSPANVACSRSSDSGESVDSWGRHEEKQAKKSGESSPQSPYIVFACLSSHLSQLIVLSFPHYLNAWNGLQPCVIERHTHTDKDILNYLLSSCLWHVNIEIVECIIAYHASCHRSS